MKAAVKLVMFCGLMHSTLPSYYSPRRRQLGRILPPSRPAEEQTKPTVNLQEEARQGGLTLQTLILLSLEGIEVALERYRSSNCAIHSSPGLGLHSRPGGLNRIFINDIIL